MDRYRQLLSVLDFIRLPSTFPELFFADSIYRAQAQYIRYWLRLHPQRGELLNAILLAATALEQLAAYQFTRAETNMQKATQRILTYRDQLHLDTRD